MSHQLTHSQSEDSHGRPFSLSPPPHRPHHHCVECVIVDRVIEKSSSSIAYPMLTCMNYTEWSLVMKVNL
jgi:hypothetical protein